MGEEMEKNFTWVLKKFSSLQHERCYSRPFTVAGYNWHLCAFRKGDKNDGHLSLFVELADPESLPPGWRRDAKFSLTLVTKGCGKSNLVLVGQRCFNARERGWGAIEFVSLTKLRAKDEGFLVNNKLTILAGLHVLPAAVVPEETEKFTVPLSNKEGNQADDASLGKSQGDSSSSQVAQETDEDDASEEGSDGDDDTSDNGIDDDASSPASNDGGRDIGLSNQSNTLEDASHTVGDHDVKSNSVAAETEVSNGDNDDARKEDVDEEASSLVSNDSARNGTSLDQVKSLEDASQTVENGGKGLNNVASVTETANNLLKEIQPSKETMDVNGFEVFSSQVESVRHIFKRHPEIASGFRPKNQQIRKAYMNELLSVIELMCESPEKLSEDDLSKADETLADLTDVGFKLDWLKTKVSEVSEKKKKEQTSGARLQTMEEQLHKLKLMFLDLQTQLQMEKSEALAARAPLSFNDVVC